MIQVFAYVALVVSLTAMSLCHQREQFPGMAWLRRKARRTTPAPDPPGAPNTRPTPSWARDEHDHQEAA